MAEVSSHFLAAAPAEPGGIPVPMFGDLHVACPFPLPLS